MREIWRVLYEFNAELVVNGHDHLYERFAPQDPDGRLDSARGIRQITVGTGGGSLYTPVTSAANQEAIGIVHGVLRLTLNDTGYQWQFMCRHQRRHTSVWATAAQRASSSISTYAKRSRVSGSR